MQIQGRKVKPSATPCPPLGSARPIERSIVGGPENVLRGSHPLPPDPMRVRGSQDHGTPRRTGASCRGKRVRTRGRRGLNQPFYDPQRVIRFAGIDPGTNLLYSAKRAAREKAGTATFAPVAANPFRLPTAASIPLSAPLRSARWTISDRCWPSCGGSFARVAASSTWSTGRHPMRHPRGGSASSNRPGSRASQIAIEGSRH